MRRAIALALVFGVAALSLAGAAAAVARDDDDNPPGRETPETFAEYVEYRCLPELGQITISDGIVRGRRTVASVKAKAKELSRRGVFPCVDRDQPHAYRRRDEMSGRRFDTVIVITPPAADGSEDDDWGRRVTVSVDGRRKVDCSIGQSPDGLFVYGVTIFPEDGTVEVAAVADDGTELLPPEEFESIDDPGVITDETLQPVPEDEGVEEEAPRIEKASGCRPLRGGFEAASCA